MRRTIIGSVVVGILVFFSFIGLLNYYFRPLIFKTTENVGYVGTYTVQTLPREILDEVSYGLVRVDLDGSILPSAATSWTIGNNKEYLFRLRPGIRFHNGEELTSSNVSFNFSDVTVKKIDKYTIKYFLKNPYSPFLVSVSSPIFGKKLNGIGRYKVDDIDLNGGFVRSITFSDTTKKDKKKKIYFYPTERALKIALMLGEVNKIFDLESTKIDKTDLSKWKSVKTHQSVNFKSLVTIFYNSDDSILNNKKIRQALNYALPAKIKLGERAFGPIPPGSIYFSQSPTYKISDIELAKTLLSTLDEPIGQELVIQTTEGYQMAAIDIQKAWKKIGVRSKIKIVQDIPIDFQIFLFEIRIPEDPDQYVLWHSDQINNITHYKNLRIDKLLEDGRSITGVDKRKKIYADFQKYLSDDVPASFFYFPREFDLAKVR